MSYSRGVSTHHTARPLPRRRPRPWTPATGSIVLLPAAEGLTDVRPLLAHLLPLPGRCVAGAHRGSDRSQRNSLPLGQFRNFSQWDVRPLLARIIEALGTNAAARLLDADRGQVSRWGSGKEAVSAEMGRRIVDLHDVLTRILRVYSREAASIWLIGSEPLLGGARPIDVLVSEGASPVVRAIDGISQGAYA